MMRPWTTGYAPIARSVAVFSSEGEVGQDALVHERDRGRKVGPRLAVAIEVPDHRPDPGQRLGDASPWCRTVGHGEPQVEGLRRDEQFDGEDALDVGKDRPGM